MISKSSKQLKDLLEDIHQIAGSSQDGAISMPPEVFTSAELLDLERERIFSKEWICVGRFTGRFVGA